MTQQTIFRSFSLSLSHYFPGKTEEKILFYKSLLLLLLSLLFLMLLLLMFKTWINYDIARQKMDKCSEEAKEVLSFVCQAKPIIFPFFSMFLEATFAHGAAWCNYRNATRDKQSFFTRFCLELILPQRAHNHVGASALTGENHSCWITITRGGGETAIVFIQREGIHSKPTCPFMLTCNALWDKTRSFWGIWSSFFPRAQEWVSGASKRANERTDERVAQYLHPDSWLFCPTVQ